MVWRVLSVCALVSAMAAVCAGDCAKTQPLGNTELWGFPALSVGWATGARNSLTLLVNMEDTLTPRNATARFVPQVGGSPVTLAWPAPVRDAGTCRLSWNLTTSLAALVGAAGETSATTATHYDYHFEVDVAWYETALAVDSRNHSQEVGRFIHSRMSFRLYVQRQVQLTDSSIDIISGAVVWVVITKSTVNVVNGSPQVVVGIETRVDPGERVTQMTLAGVGGQVAEVISITGGADTAVAGRNSQVWDVTLRLAASACSFRAGDYFALTYNASAIVGGGSYSGTFRVNVTRSEQWCAIDLDTVAVTGTQTTYTDGSFTTPSLGFAIETPVYVAGHLSAGAISVAAVNVVRVVLSGSSLRGAASFTIFPNTTAEAEVHWVNDTASLPGCPAESGCFGFSLAGAHFGVGDLIVTATYAPKFPTSRRRAALTSSQTLSLDTTAAILPPSDKGAKETPQEPQSFKVYYAVLGALSGLVVVSAVIVAALGVAVYRSKKAAAATTRGMTRLDNN